MRRPGRRGRRAAQPGHPHDADRRRSARYAPPSSPTARSRTGGSARRAARGRRPGVAGTRRLRRRRSRWALGGADPATPTRRSTSTARPATSGFARRVSLRRRRAFSIELWVKRRGASAGRVRPAARRPAGAYIRIKRRRPRASTHDGVEIGRSTADDHRQTGWHHVVWTSQRGAAMQHLHRRGRTCTGLPSRTRPRQHDDSAWSRRHERRTEFRRAAVDEVAIYNKALSPRTPGRPPTTRRPRTGGGARRGQRSDPATLDGARPAARPGHGRRDGRQPEHRVARPQRAADRRLRLPEPVPVHLPAGHERAVGRRRGLERLGGDRPDREPDRRRRRTTAGRATRARAARRPTTTSTSAICEGLYAAVRRR